MAEIPENKQKRLMSLNQDVLAVGSARAEAQSRAPDDRAPRPHRAARPQDAAAPVPGRPVPLLAAATLIASLSLVAGIAGVIIGFSAQRDLEAMQARQMRPDPELQALRDRIQELEDRLGAAAQETSADDGMAASLLQTNSRLRKLALDLTRLGKDLGGLQSRLDAAGSTASQAQGLVKEQSRRLDELASRVDRLASASAPAAAGTSASEAEAALEQQLVQLNMRVDKQAADIRAIYRLLEQTR